MFMDLSKYLPKFLQPSLISPPTLWGKLPSRADFIRHNLKHTQGEALQAWIRTQLHSPVVPGSSTDTAPAALLPQVITTKVAKKRRADASLWHALSPSVHASDDCFFEPENSSTSAAKNRPVYVTPAYVTPAVMGHAGLPWCFVLPPGTLPFATKEHVIGVWMMSSDKVARQYPLVMIQTASPRWIKQYFSQHTQQPCEWLYAAARAMAKAVYADETQVDRPTGDGQLQDNLQTLVTQLNAMWHTMRPGWGDVFGGVARKSATSFDSMQAQEIIGAPHPADPVRHLDGVRFLPWNNWPQKLTASQPQPAYWQQDLQGRFVAATVNLNA